MQEIDNFTNEQIREVLNYFKKWDKKVVFKFGYFFKLVDFNQIEIFNKEQNKYFILNLDSCTVN